MNKEYGGYLPLELPKRTPYYAGDDVIALNAGRYAITYAIEDAGWKTIYLPYWLCDTVKQAIQTYLPSVSIHYYHINQNLLPDSVMLSDKEGILWVNYFGLQSELVIDHLIQQYNGQIIVDNTQSFFTAPRPDVWQVYSCRKFFGVSDGSYVIHKGIRHETLPAHFSSTHASHLLHSLEYGTNYAYSANKENESYLEHCGSSQMSALTSAILLASDYQQVIRKRIHNLNTLHKILAPYNDFPVMRTAPAMSYPFLCNDSSLRERLIKQKVYVPRLWAETSENPMSDSWEKYLSDYLCTLPIDQRYNEQDMEYIGNLVVQMITSSKNID